MMGVPSIGPSGRTTCVAHGVRYVHGICLVCRRRAPQLAQLDLDGKLHDLAPANERMRLFEPAPAQLDGQTWVPELAELETETTHNDDEGIQR